MKACRMLLVIPTVGIRGNFIIELFLCFISDNFLYDPVKIVHQKFSEWLFLIKRIKFNLFDKFPNL